MRALLVGMLLLGQAAHKDHGPMPDVCMVIGYDCKIAADGKWQIHQVASSWSSACFEALKASHEATRAAWAPHLPQRVSFDPSLTAWGNCACGGCVTPNLMPDSERYECLARQARAEEEAYAVKAKREQKARDLLDAADKACGWDQTAK